VTLQGCKVPGSGQERTLNALALTGITLVIYIIIFIIVLSGGFRILHDRLRRVSLILGIFFGSIAAVILTVSVPVNIQFLLVGSILGLGANLVTAARQPTAGVTTAIGSLARLVSGTVKAISDAAGQTRMSAPDEAALALGLWAFLATILITLAIGHAMPDVSLFPAETLLPRLEPARE
jgi:hypothetical protein